MDNEREIPIDPLRLRKLRIKLGYTQEEIAPKIGMVRGGIARLEDARKSANRMRLKAFRKLAEHCELSIEQLRREIGASEAAAKANTPQPSGITPYIIELPEENGRALEIIAKSRRTSPEAIIAEIVVEAILNGDLGQATTPRRHESAQGSSHPPVGVLTRGSQRQTVGGKAME